MVDEDKEKAWAIAKKAHLASLSASCEKATLSQMWSAYELSKKAASAWRAVWRKATIMLDKKRRSDGNECERQPADKRT